MFSKPICVQCNKNEATIKFVRIVGGKVSELNLCKDCAGKLSPHQKKISEQQANLSEILQKLLTSTGEGQPTPEGEAGAKVKVDLTCKDCGLKFENYRNSLFLGCSGCYESFEKYLLSDLRRLHGSTQHQGKVPLRFRVKLQHLRAINNLQQELEKSIEEEDFEKAARIRDQIRSMKEQIDVK